ncbi:hypothetical protein IEO21_01278 [Rhodonia placenta]|uniref:Uncharacterized protein n=2 Tax=Rhodonia placenta TaxID=104341 RepID=A0A1X6N6T4_9APHY|nr:hypothetical protein POSPLADRAFT_1054934 [Postia placenta MAD-698-R-SB12]KAF9820575.1 hypothetical protein IEO21_01278 [Postia placenta]OSX64321.1 hypothetical protein POSPLADRAFT_1054934 [Postia placenta MAD-698-R-SB12]
MASRFIAASIPEMQKPRISCTKYLERRIIQAWKSFSQSTRKHERASILPEDFVLMTARRRSVRFT